MFRGMGISAGIGLGNIVILHQSEVKISREKITDKEKEWKGYTKAVEEFVLITTQAVEKIQKKIGTAETDLLTKEIKEVANKEMNEDIKNEIFKHSLPAVAAVEDVSQRYFEQLVQNEPNQAKIEEKRILIADIKKRMQKILLGIEDVDIKSLPKDSILVMDELTPTLIADLNPKHIAGIIAESGGKNAHAAIIARMLEIPTVFGVVGFADFVTEGDPAIIDGGEGIIYVRPRIATYKQYRKKRDKELKDKESLVDFATKKTQMRDGTEVLLCGNIEKPSDVYKILEKGGEGIGLFRTEFLFVDRSNLPNEDEQFEAYKEAAVALNGKPMIIRTLDIGGDKKVSYLGLLKEANPFLGYRAIRFSLGRMDIFQTQLRAILRASAYGCVKIMIPMVTSIEELRRAKTLIDLMKEDLEYKGIAFDRQIQIGVMIETPAAALLVDLFARESDFISIGTNDLIQYTMAVDRGNRRVSYLYSNYHPAIIRSIRSIIKQSKAAGKKVTMCGEAARDIKMVPLLLAFGLDEFSVSSSAILKIRRFISKWDKNQLKGLEEKVLQLDTAEEIENYLDEFLKVNK